ncbi:putative transmembrane protein [Tetrahymena thermophila SB210]|uniref:Putative transmembrane protein n=1 Tax=Tetrahymena thermophila (strain SB210) TaxID=312017 RepID=A0A1B9C276_TETTS|nr:putative transmembrane protein [Tetrahymena thermophila SB210]
MIFLKLRFFILIQIKGYTSSAVIILFGYKLMIKKKLQKKIQICSSVKVLELRNKN